MRLRDVVTGMFVGQQTSADTVYLFKQFRPIPSSDRTEVYSQVLSKWVEVESSILKPVVRSGSIGRYGARQTAVVLFPYNVRDCSAQLISASKLQHEYPLGWRYLDCNRDVLRSREKGKFRDAQWYRFGRNQNLGMWEQPKLMVPYMITRLAAYLDAGDGYYFINVTTGGYGITVDEAESSLPYLTGLLNSKLLDFYFKRVSTNFNSGYYAANKQYIEQLPIRTIDFTDLADVARHDRLVAQVERMLDLNRRLGEARTPQERTVLQAQIDATDRQIDHLVYDLYGLTEEEVAVVEGVELKATSPVPWSEPPRRSPDAE